MSAVDEIVEALRQAEDSQAEWVAYHDGLRETYKKTADAYARVRGLVLAGEELSLQDKSVVRQARYEQGS